MAKTDPRIDAYIAKSAEFARPILTHLREIVHAACPEIEETLKWGHPSFLYKKKILCGMAAFKQHCTFGFWKGTLIVAKGGKTDEEAMGQFGRITKIADLPPKKIIAGYAKEAMRLNDEGIKAPKAAPKPPKPLIVPEILQKALAKNAKARKSFEAFSTSHKREYCEWIDEAKTDATRERRLATTLEWLAEGKPRNWKYMNC
jgi:uncharacterized protein YdeI (YjbR/CyaY-like superfamily)